MIPVKMPETTTIRKPVKTREYDGLRIPGRGPYHSYARSYSKLCYRLPFLLTTRHERDWPCWASVFHDTA